jgi:hypothetical protein
MKNHPTNRDRQRADFTESLYTSLKVQANKVVKDHDRLSKIASSYIEDGLSEDEAIELLMISDGLPRDDAENYVTLANSDSDIYSDGELHEYNFRFEDDYGRIWNSFEINRTVHAATEEEAWRKAEELSDPDIDIYPSKIISVNRVD